MTRYLLLALVVAGTAALTWAVCVSVRSGREEPAAGPGGGIPPPRDREEEIERLLLENRRLQQEVSRLRAEAEEAPEPGPPPEPAGATPASSPEPRQTLEELLAAARDQAAPLNRRLLAVGALTNPDLCKGPDVESTLLALLGPEQPRALRQTVLRALRLCGGSEALGYLLRNLWSDGLLQVSADALKAIVQIAGRDANRMLEDLFEMAPHENGQKEVLKRLTDEDPATALRVIDRAFGLGPGARIAAAKALGRLRGPDFRAYVESRLTREEDGNVAGLLRNAEQRQKTVPRWHALRATGPANVKNPRSDDPDAWATHRPDGGAEWLLLTYDPPIAASSARIHEVHVAGGLARLEAEDVSGTVHLLWQGTDPTAEPGVFEVEFPLTDYGIKRLRLILDTARRQGWNEIDAVELAGPDGRAWATDAHSSSNYGEG